jgi:hypothetical protein
VQARNFLLSYSSCLTLSSLLPFCISKKRKEKRKESRKKEKQEFTDMRNYFNMK